MKTEQIMGIPVDNLTYDDILQVLPDYLESDKKMTAISVNPQIIVESKNYPDIVDFIQKSTHRIPDGIGIVLVSKLTGGQIKQRVTGFELMNIFLKYANQHSKKVFFYGARPEILCDMIERLEQDYPQMKIVGHIDGYTTLTEDQIVEAINQVVPDFLFVALGFPKQEQWIYRNISRVQAHVFQDVGGSFDVLSGHVKRAPQVFINLNLEWLYRSLSNPQKISRIFQLPVFVIKSLWWRKKNFEKNAEKNAE